MLFLCLVYGAPMGVSMALTMWCFYGLYFFTTCACLYDTSVASLKGTANVYTGNSLDEIKQLIAILLQ
jgi:hypothetical protein